MNNRTLSEKQQLLMNNLPDSVLDRFYLAGGTALSAFYLEHRLSQDLDLFTDAEENMPPVEYLTNLIHRLPAIAEVRYERLFDRRIFAVTFTDGEPLKVEFTSYPFGSIDKRLRAGKLMIDSLLNILTGKLFALTDRYDPKDFVDLYFALEYNYYGGTLSNLVSQTGERFKVKGMDYLIPERLLMVKRIGVDDLPLMLKEISLEKMKRYFLEQSAVLVKTRMKSQK
jgi:hypothetical protein